MSLVKEIDPSELQALLTSSPGDIRMLDVRTPQEVQQGSLPHSDHIPLHLIPLRMAELTPDRTWVIYCRSGARSAQACAFLASHGILNTLNLKGGIMAWQRQGLSFA